MDSRGLRPCHYPHFHRAGVGLMYRGGRRRRRGLRTDRAEAQAKGRGVMEDDVSTTTLAAPHAWAAEQFGEVDLGDRRRTRRVVRLAEQMARHPAASLPAQTSVWRETKAGYRLFAEEDVSFEALQAQHLAQTQAVAGQRPLTPLIQDTSELDFTHRRTADDLGPIGDGGGRGFLLHSTLAVDPTGVGEVRGLADQTLFLRQPAPAGETRSQWKQRPRESQVWAQRVAAIGGRPAGSRWLHVADRGADDCGFFAAGTAVHVGFLVRAYQDRRMAAGHTATEPEDRLLPWARAWPAAGRTTLEVRARPQRKRRTAPLRVAYGAVTLFPPWLDREPPEPVRCWLVRVWEPDTPAGEEPIEWLLLTSAAVTTSAAAVEVARWYSLRWLVEEYHKCLKTGCAVETRPMEPGHRLAACTAVLAIVAVRRLQLKLAARHAPQRPALAAGPVDHVRVLAAYRGVRAEDWSIYQFWREVAKLGGFLGRKGDGEPGWQTLWRGWQQLDLMTIGAQLARAENPNCG